MEVNVFEQERTSELPFTPAERPLIWRSLAKGVSSSVDFLLERNRVGVRLWSYWRHQEQVQ